MTIGFIGLGNMARAVIGGMLDKGIVKPEDICGSAKTEATRKKMEDSCKIRTASSNREVAEQAEILVLAVKPQFFEEVNFAGRTQTVKEGDTLCLGPVSYTHLRAHET